MRSIINGKFNMISLLTINLHRKSFDLIFPCFQFRSMPEQARLFFHVFFAPIFQKFGDCFTGCVRVRMALLFWRHAREELCFVSRFPSRWLTLGLVSVASFECHFSCVRLWSHETVLHKAHSKRFPLFNL